MRFVKMIAAGLANALMASALAAEEEPIVFSAQDGTEVPAFEGAFEVPENRADPDSRQITMRYVRFPATGEAAGAPIVYLAGGPGGSGIRTAKGPRFPLFMALREHGDVIAFDQRGTGASDMTETCASPYSVPSDRAVDPAEAVETYRQAARHCFDWWEEQGIDAKGYTTLESARDLDALRQHLGADKITLWGISYGTHLALAAMKEMPRGIDKAILASVEGLDQTVKLPARTDAYFERLQLAINERDDLRAQYPDIVAMIQRVQREADENPRVVQVPQRGGEPIDVWLDGDTFRAATSGMISDPGRALSMLSIYQAADQGIYEPFLGLLSFFYNGDDTIRFRTMSLAMDMASGVSDKRMALFEEQAPSGLVGPYLNIPMPQLRNAVPGLALGPKFRRIPRNRIPTLVLTGTLDGRTYPAGQVEATRGLRKRQTVIVENAGHNLFMVSPEVGQVMGEFLAGEPLSTTNVVVPLP
ncbi:MAG: alpha/beta hydrolase [Pseudomonadota bacterium]